MKAYLPILITFLFISFCIKVNAQFTVGVEASYVGGINNSHVYIHHTEIQQNWFNGYQLNAITGYKLKKFPVSILLKTGYKSIFSVSQIPNLKYRTNTKKIVINPGLMYYINPKISTGLYLGIENNLDFEEFRTQTSDLFRYSLQPEVNYHVRKNLSITLTLYTTITPTIQHYYITNPQHQVFAGIQYTIK